MDIRYSIIFAGLLIINVLAISIVSAENEFETMPDSNIGSSDLRLNFNIDNNVDIDLQDIEEYSDININIDENFIFSDFNIDIDNNFVNSESSMHYPNSGGHNSEIMDRMTSGSFSARNAPFGLLGGRCSKSPVLIFGDLRPGQELKITEIHGTTCALTAGAGGTCINNPNKKCTGKIKCASNGGIKVGFFDKSNHRIAEYPIKTAREGITVPSNAEFAYIYFRERNSNKDWYFDNNGGARCKFEASLKNINDPYKGH